MGNQSVRSFDHYKSQKMHLRSILIILGLFLFQPGNAQSIVGQVKDAKGVPLPSASVIVDGTNGQFADIDGRFNFQLQPGTHEVRFSFIGYISQNRTVELAGEDIEFNIVLEEDAVMIDDVVVVGYGVQRKK